MWRLVVSFLEKPWIAAVALLVQAVVLLVQAVILLLQWRILRHHGEVMEQHTDIGRIQVKTAQLIGDAIQQQGQILEAQFTFQKRIDAKAEREQVFEKIFAVARNVRALSNVLANIPPGTSRDFAKERIDRSWNELGNSATECQKGLTTSIHIPEDVKNYFIRFCGVVSDAVEKQEDDVSAARKQLRQLEVPDKDFSAMLRKLAQAPIGAG